MKKILSFLALASIATLSMVGCNKDADKTQAGIPDNITNSKLTPDEHKANLEQTAIDFINYIDPADTEAIMASTYALAQYMSYAYEDEYYNQMAMDLAMGVKNLSAYHFTQFITRATEEIIIDFNDPENPLGGVCLTFDGEEWVESEIANNMIKLVWDDSVALFSWKGSDKWEYEFKQEDVNVIVYVPNTITFSLTINGVEHISIVTNTKITSNHTIACDNEVKINGGYCITSGSDANDKGIESKSSVTKDGKKILGNTMAIAIDDFTNLDNWYYEYYDEWYETNVTELDPSVYFSENVKNGTFRVDVLNLSFVAAGDFKGMADAIEKLDEEDDEKTYCDMLCDLLNKRTDIVLFYNNTNERIAEVVFQTAWYDEWDGYYDIEPIILFPDGSKYAFEDYFTESAFGDLIEELESLANEFIGMVE